MIDLDLYSENIAVTSLFMRGMENNTSYALLDRKKQPVATITITHENAFNIIVFELDEPTALRASERYYISLNGLSIFFSHWKKMRQ